MAYIMPSFLDGIFGKITVSADADSNVPLSTLTVIGWRLFQRRNERNYTPLNSSSKIVRLGQIQHRINVLIALDTGTNPGVFHDKESDFELFPDYSQTGKKLVGKCFLASRDWAVNSDAPETIMAVLAVNGDITQSWS